MAAATFNQKASVHVGDERQMPQLSCRITAPEIEIVSAQRRQLRKFLSNLTSDDGSRSCVKVASIFVP